MRLSTGPEATRTTLNAWPSSSTAFRKPWSDSHCTASAQRPTAEYDVSSSADERNCALERRAVAPLALLRGSSAAAAPDCLTELGTRHWSTPNIEEEVEMEAESGRYECTWTSGRRTKGRSRTLGALALCVLVAPLKATDGLPWCDFQLTLISPSSTW